MTEFIHYDFSTLLPDRWLDASVVVLAGPPRDGFSPNVTFTRERLDYAFAPHEYAANQLVTLQQGFADQNFEVIEESRARVAGMDAFQRIHRFSVPEDGADVSQLQVYIIRGEEAITITCTDLTIRFESTRSAFLTVIKNLRFR